MKNSFSIFKHLLWKDLILELRSKDFIISVLIFSILTITVFSQAINFTTINPNEIGPAILWVSVAFSAAIGIPKIYAKEKEENTIESLLVTPINRDLIFLAKSTSIFILLIFCEIIIFSLSIVFFNIQLFNPIIILISIITTFGYSTVGALFGAMMIRTRTSEFLLPIIFLPIIIPLLIFAIGSTEIALEQNNWVKSLPWIGLGITYNLVFFPLSIFLFEKIIIE
jgi:heme exporter protein B